MSKVNKHLEHVEDLILNDGLHGAAATINHLSATLRQLQGSQDQHTLITEKWDGSPAICLGNLPSENLYFIATKGLFNKEPKYATSEEEIKEMFSEGLAAKLIPVFKAFQRSNFSGIFQGDLLFWDKECKVKTKLNNVDYLTVKPNTLVYGAPSTSSLYNTVQNKDIGIVWHTYYGDNLNSLEKTQNLQYLDIPEAQNAYSVSAQWESRADAMDMFSTQFINKRIHALKQMFGALCKDNDNAVPEGYEEIAVLLKRFYNVNIKQGTSITTAGNYLKDFQLYVNDHFEKEASKVKLERTKKQKYDKRDALLQRIADNHVFWMNVIEFQKLAIDIKMTFLHKMNNPANFEIFVGPEKNLVPTDPEGYVLTYKDETVKLVNRFVFSKLNFADKKNYG